MSDVVITPNRGVATEGKIEFFSGATPALSGTISISSGNITIVPEGAGTVQVGKVGNTTTIPGDLTVTGNLTINGTTTTVNSTTVTVDDPIFTIGGDAAPSSDDNKDRGIAFRWHNGTAAKLGFFGYDDSTGKFTFIADATDTSDVFSGTTGEIDAKLDWANVLNKPTIGSGTVTSVSFTGGIVSVGTATTTPALTVAGTSGGIPYFSSTSTWASSAALAANAIVVGGGAGNAPATVTTGTGVVTALGVNVGSAGAFVTNGGALGTPSSGTLSSCTGYTVANLSGLGTGAATALAVNVGSAGAFVTNGGALGTPSSGTLSSCTGLPVSTGISGLGTGVATALAVNVGSAGAFVTNGGALGTPSSGTLSSCTGLPISTGVSGLASGVATFLATPSSANLASAVTDETGSGALVFGTNPTLGLPRFSSNVSVSAAGTTQGTATALTSDFNVVTSVTQGSAQGVRLPAGVAGIKVVVRNAAANTVNVYPETGATLDGFTANSPRAIIAGGIMEFIAVSSTQWYTYGSLMDTATIKDPYFQIGSNPAFDFSTTVTTTKRSYKFPDSDADILTSVTAKTGSGNLVFATSPSLTTPSLGAATATSINGLTVSTSTGTLTVANGKTLTASNTLTFTGTDASSVAFGAGGTVLYNGGALGTPSSGTLSSCTGLPVSTGISGLGTGVATFLATPSSANLASAVTDETGSGALVFGTSPSLTTPALSGETFSTAATVTAGTNAQGQGALTNDYNVITTTSANPSGVTLPTATTGRRIVVVNRGTNPINVYPATSGFIDALAINTSIQIPVNGIMVFNASSTTQWYSTATSTFTAPVLGTPTSGTLSNCTGLPVSTGISGLGTGVATALAVNVGSAGAFVTNGGALGTPSSGTLSSCTGLPVSTGISGLGTGVATALAVNVGSAGAFVTNGGALGTPSSGTLSSCTGLPVSTGISGLATGVATFLATPSSANLASALTSKTGTGDNVFGTSPTITTSLIAGSATMALFNTTATTINFGGAATTMTIGATGSGTVTIGYNLTVTNKLEATTKSFVIDHPTKWKEGMKLRYACLEGPENGVYVRGALEDNDTIELPEYWVNLVDADSITVNLTPIGSSNGHYVKSIKNNVITVGSRSGNINCHYIVYGERKDVSKLVVEYHAA